MDEDDVRTRRYWKRWGGRAARELVKTIDRERAQKSVRRREPIYSARVREPVFRKDDDSSSDSDATGISLLTTSSVRLTDLGKVKFASRSPRRKNSEKPRVDWEKFARKRTGLLEQMVRADASALGTLVSGGAEALEVNAREKAIDLMSREEVDMLTRAAYGKGLCGSNKSQSTENVMTLWPHLRKKRVTSALKPMSASTAGATAATSRPMSRSSVTFSANLTRSHPPSRGVTPTPQQVRLQVQSRARSGSTSAVIKLRQSAPGVLSRVERNQSLARGTESNVVPEAVRKYMEGVKGLPDFEGTFTKRVRERITRTVSALQRIVGSGDELDVIAEIPGEKGRYTIDDYAARPKYPQRVLITSQLASVIKSDIKIRMGRPRLHKIRKHDLASFDAQNPALDRSNRNLLIFNWLSSLNERDFDVTAPPEIVEIEGDAAQPYKNVLRHDDVMTTNSNVDAASRAQTSLSHVSGGDGSDFDMTSFDDDHVSLGASDVDDDTRTEGERLSPGMSYLSSTSRPTFKT